MRIFQRSLKDLWKILKDLQLLKSLARILEDFLRTLWGSSKDPSKKLAWGPWQRSLKILEDPMRVLQRSLKDPYGDLEKIFISILKDPQGFFEDPLRILKRSSKWSWKIFIKILKDTQGFFEDPSGILKGSLRDLKRSLSGSLKILKGFVRIL